MFTYSGRQRHRLIIPKKHYHRGYREDNGDLSSSLSSSFDCAESSATRFLQGCMAVVWVLDSRSSLFPGLCFVLAESVQRGERLLVFSEGSASKQLAS
jgi:hypothetical protein